MLQLTIPRREEPTLPGDLGVEIRSSPSAWLIVGEPAVLASALWRLWRRGYRGHRIDARRRPPKTEEAGDVREGCVVVVDRHGVEHGPHCDEDTMDEWIDEKLALIVTQWEGPDIPRPTVTI